MNNLHKYTHKFVQAFLLFLTFVPCSAREAPVKNYDVKNGLSENSVRCIMQDSLGYMWFGTKDGLNRFNGVGFTAFGSSASGQACGNMSVIELCAHRDRAHIWVATIDSLYLFSPNRGTFSTFKEKTGDGIGIRNVFKLCYDDTGILWIATGYGLFAYREQSGELTHYRNSRSDPNSLPDDHVWTLLTDSSGILWVGTRTGLARYNPAADNFQVYRHVFPGGGRELPFEITSLVEAADGTIWTGTRFDGVARFEKNTGLFSFYRTPDPTGENSRVRALQQQTSDTFFVGTEDGLFYLTPGTFDLRRDERFGCIYSFYRDREGGVWIGSYFNGVYYISPKSSEIEWFYDTGKPGSLSGNAVSQFCEDRDGNIWIATEDGGLNYFDAGQDSFRNYKADGTAGSITSNNIHALMLEDNRLWLGTFSKGIDIIDLPSGEITNLRYSGSDQETLPNNHIYSIFKTRTGDIYVGTMAGFGKYIPETGGFQRIDRLQGVFVYDMCEDKRGHLWIATRGAGIWRYTPSDGEFHNYIHSADREGTPPGNWIIRVYIDRNGDIWFCTDGTGICRYDPDSDSFISYNSTSGLANNVIYGILDDELGRLWLSSNSGIIRFDPATMESHLYTYEDGLQSNQFNFRSSMKSRDGKFYFGGLEGFNSFYPGRLTINTVRPTTVISGFSSTITTFLVKTGTAPICQASTCGYPIRLRRST